MATEYPLSDAQIVQLAYRVRSIIRSEAKTVPEVPVVDTLNDIESLPVVQKVGGVYKYVRAPIKLLSEPAWDAVGGRIEELKSAIDKMDKTIDATEVVISKSKAVTEEGKEQIELCKQASAEVMQMAVVMAGELEKLIQKGEASITTIDKALTEFMGAACMVPYRMEVDYPKKITLGNPEAQQIRVILWPIYYPQNFIFQTPKDDGSAVDIDPLGNVRVLKVGTSKIHVIPTHNPGIYETITIEVQLPRPLMAGDIAFLDHDGTVFLT